LWFRQNKDEHYYNKVAWGKVFLKKSWRSEVERQRIESKARVRIGTLRKNRDYIVYPDKAVFRFWDTEVNREDTEKRRDKEDNL
jgi:hypothetical protein